MPSVTDRPASFRHEALLYDRPGEFLQSSTSFIRDALEADESVLVVVESTKIDWLRSALGDDADDVFFADMGGVGQNPGRIIPAWRQFVTDHAVEGRGLRGIGEPIWPGRSDDEVDECQRHESLLNLAFEDTPPWWLLCPYDTTTLAPSVIDEAYRNHPYVWHGTTRGHSDVYREHVVSAPLDGPLPEPPGEPLAMTFGDGPLTALRRFVASYATAAGLDRVRTDDFVAAANEIAANSLRHGGGQGVLRIWRNGSVVTCEVRDAGRIHEPLVGREHPTMDSGSGRGLWMANQLCDLVQLRSNASGTAVRLHVHL